MTLDPEHTQSITGSRKTTIEGSVASSDLRAGILSIFLGLVLVIGLEVVSRPRQYFRELFAIEVGAIVMMV